MSNKLDPLSVGVPPERIDWWQVIYNAASEYDSILDDDTVTVIADAIKRKTEALARQLAEATAKLEKVAELANAMIPRVERAERAELDAIVALARGALASVSPPPSTAERISMTHGLERTSPKGGPFLGRCRYCGQEHLPMRAALEACAAAPSQEQQIVDAVSPPPSQETREPEHEDDHEDSSL